MAKYEFGELPPITPPVWKELVTEWAFALGNPAERLNTSLDWLPKQRERVTLPHRTLDPDTPYWYTAEITFFTPGVLHIQADDGAQLYVNGERIPVTGDYFLLPPNAREASLIVRVLNKAMYGGLESVRMTSREEFDGYRRTVEIQARLAALARKVEALPAPSEEDVQSVRQAFEIGSLAAVLTAERQLAHFPLMLIGPYLQNAGTDRMTVVWETDVPCEAALEWGEGDSLPHRVAARSERTLHSVELTNLEPNTTYRYRLHSGPVASPPHTFRALPAAGSFAFAVCADSQNAWDALGRIVSALQRLPLAFTVGLGDMVEAGHQQAPWHSLFATLAPLVAETPLFLLGGNHDYDGCFEDLRSVYFERYARNRPKPQYFAWTAGVARCVALDPNPHFPTGIPEDSEQMRWFLRELESPEWEQAIWRFVFIHQPPFSQGWAGYHGDLPIRVMLEPLIEPHGIDFVVLGHTHDYERLTRTYGRQTAHFLIVGGAGEGLEEGPLSEEPVMDRVIRRPHFGLFQVDGKRVTFEAVAPNGEVFDRLDVTKA